MFATHRHTDFWQYLHVFSLKLQKFSGLKIISGIPAKVNSVLLGIQMFRRSYETEVQSNDMGINNIVFG